MEINITFDSLKDQIAGLLKEHVAAASADLRADLEGEAARIAQRTAELGVRALGGDQVARENLDHMRAQAVGLAAIVTMREGQRATATMSLIASTLLKFLLAAAMPA